MGVSFLVTLEAIMRYLDEARQAQEKLNEATERMNRAAQELCNQWKGDAAEAFAQEQKVLYGHCKELHNVGEEYISVFQQAHDRYSQADADAANAIRG